MHDPCLESFSFVHNDTVRHDAPRRYITNIDDSLWCMFDTVEHCKHSTRDVDVAKSWIRDYRVSMVAPMDVSGNDCRDGCFIESPHVFQPCVFNYAHHKYMMSWRMIHRYGFDRALSMFPKSFTSGFRTLRQHVPF